MIDALDRWAQAPWAPAQQAQMPWAPVLHAPQVAPPLCQSPPGQPATPYQQAVHPPSKSTGLGVTFDSPADKAAPTSGQGAKSCRRQST